MRRRWRAALSLPLLFAPASHPARADVEQDAKSAFTACRRIADTAERLACYDALAVKLTPPTYAGRLGFQTEPFTVERPTTVRFASDGVIFVMYLKDARGEVVQNLHIGGGGEASYLIEKPGVYSLQINGAEGWRVWLEPRP